MNEFAAKKLGEVLAFAKEGNTIIEKAKKVFGEFLSEDDLQETLKGGLGHIDAINAYAAEKKVTAIVEAEAEKTATKIVSMRDIYIGSEWDVHSEVFEWWGFFGGGVIAHWNLMKGVAESLEDDGLVELCYIAIAYHENLYDSASSILAEIGRKNSKAV
jgi:hypothetical protein